jgi:hypothetical protein
MRVLGPVSLLLFVTMATSCGAVVDLSIRPDRSATVVLVVDVPPALDARIRQFAASGSSQPAGKTVPLFDAGAIEASARAKGLVVRESSSPSSHAYRGVYAVADIAALLAADPRLAGALRYERGAGWASLRVRVDKGNAAVVAGMFPGLDPDLLESLQPPALYDNPVTVAEYRTMLSGLLGKAAVASLDDLSVMFTVTVPGAIIESSGGIAAKVGGTAVTVDMRALDAMVLDVPISFYLKWKE